MTTQEKCDNIQFTLTFRGEVNKQKADRILLNWLRPLRSQKHTTLDFRIISEIGSNLKYHYHGYFKYDNDVDKHACLYLLYKWKNRHGYVGISKGALDGWKAYISKDIGAPYQLLVNKINLQHLLLKQNKEIAEASARGDLLDYITSNPDKIINMVEN